MKSNQLGNRTQRSLLCRIYLWNINLKPPGTTFVQCQRSVPALSQVYLFSKLKGRDSVVDTEQHPDSLLISILAHCTAGKLHEPMVLTPHYRKHDKAFSCSGTSPQCNSALQWDTTSVLSARHTGQNIRYFHKSFPFTDIHSWVSVSVY